MESESEILVGKQSVASAVVESEKNAAESTIEQNVSATSIVTVAPADVVEAKDELNCEQILLPPEVITTNGGTEDDEANADAFCDEQDPMADVTEPEIIGLENAEVTDEDDENDEESAEIVADGDDVDAVVNINEITEKESSTKTLPKKRKRTTSTLNIHTNETVEIKPEFKEKAEECEEEPPELIVAVDKETKCREDVVDVDQCRVCTTKVDLVCIFKVIERMTVAEMLMIICPSVAIAPKDFMPQFICNPCLDNVTIAIQLKNQCESTERELRKKLSRSKNKIRRPTGYVVIDAPLESDPQSEDETNDDVEFKVSEASVSAEDDSEDSDISDKKKRTTRAVASRRRRRKTNTSITRPQSRGQKDKKRMVAGAKHSAIEYVGGSSDEDIEESGGGGSYQRKNAKKLKRSSSNAAQMEYPCDECNQVFTRKLSLVLHKKSHSGGRDPINCEVCGKQFKILGAYRTHLEKHRDGSISFECDKCDKHFPSKNDVKRHLANEHNDLNNVVQCEKCKRNFASESRLARHLDRLCPGFECKSNMKKSDYEGFALGRDLFKSVAPLKTTYWSDSFSD